MRRSRIVKKHTLTKMKFGINIVIVLTRKPK